eukprot:m.110662 g.110662  ORF g.110662 m.110662 type:complete len:895 (-) comp14046_c0_seq5:49-2733(-)
MQSFSKCKPSPYARQFVGIVVCVLLIRLVIRYIMKSSKKQGAAKVSKRIVVAADMDVAWMQPVLEADTDGLLKLIKEQDDSVQRCSASGQTLSHALLMQKSDRHRFCFKKVVEHNSFLLHQECSTGSYEGETAFSAAVRLEDKPTIALLLSELGDSLLKGNGQELGDTLASRALLLGIALKKNSVLHLLLKAAQGHLMLSDKDGNNILHKTVYHQNKHALELIMAVCSSSEILKLTRQENNNGLNPLAIAAFRDQADMFDFTLRKTQIYPSDSGDGKVLILDDFIDEGKIFGIMDERESTRVLTLPLVQRVMQLKWEQGCRSRHRIDMGATVFGIGLLSLLAASDPYDGQFVSREHVQLFSLLEIFSCVYEIFLLWMSTSFRSPLTFAGLLRSMLLVSAFFLRHIPSNVDNWMLLASICAWLHLLSYLLCTKRLGPLILVGSSALVAGLRYIVMGLLVLIVGLMQLRYFNSSINNNGWFPFTISFSDVRSGAVALPGGYGREEGVNYVGVRLLESAVLCSIFLALIKVGERWWSWAEGRALLFRLRYIQAVETKKSSSRYLDNATEEVILEGKPSKGIKLLESEVEVEFGSPNVKITSYISPSRGGRTLPQAPSRRSRKGIGSPLAGKGPASPPVAPTRKIRSKSSATPDSQPKTDRFGSVPGLRSSPMLPGSGGRGVAGRPKRQPQEVADERDSASKESDTESSRIPELSPGVQEATKPEKDSAHVPFIASELELTESKDNISKVNNRVAIDQHSDSKTLNDSNIDNPKNDQEISNHPTLVESSTAMSREKNAGVSENSVENTELVNATPQENNEDAFEIGEEAEVFDKAPTSLAGITPTPATGRTSTDSNVNAMEGFFTEQEIQEVKKIEDIPTSTSTSTSCELNSSEDEMI